MIEARGKKEAKKRSEKKRNKMHTKSVDAYQYITTNMHFINMFRAIIGQTTFFGYY